MSLDIWLKIEVDTGGIEPYEVQLFSGNYTGNVVPMWQKAGVYEALYKSADKTAGDILPILEAGARHMRANPALYEPLNPANGWGNYEGAMKFLGEFIVACQSHPKATIGAWA